MPLPGQSQSEPTTPPSTARILRLGSRRSILGLVGRVDPSEVARGTERLARAYAAVPRLEAFRSYALALPAARAGVIVLSPQELSLRVGDVVVWGVPVSSSGSATDRELRRALADPRCAAELDGVFVLAQISADKIRLVTSPAFLFTLRRSGSAFATRAFAAVALSGRRPRVNSEAVSQAVAMQCVMGGGEVLADVEACEEATVVDVSAAGIDQRCYAPLAERLGPGPPTTPGRLREVVGEVAGRCALLPGAWLALTAGRDSALALSCLASTGRPLPTVTMGWRGLPDVEGARAAARHLGWTHEVAAVTDARGRSVRGRRGLHGLKVDGGLVDWLARSARWLEGLQHPRDALSGWLRWPRQNTVWVTGHGGETGRAFYWGNDPDADPLDTIVNGPGGHLKGAGREALAEAVRGELALAAAIGRPSDALDLLYVRRQRGWVDRGTLPLPQIRDILPVHLHSSVTQALISSPRALRQGGDLYDMALSSEHAELWRITCRATGRAAKLHRAPGMPHLIAYPDDEPLLQRVLAGLAPEGLLARDVLGEAWWSWATRAASHEPWVRGLLWNAVSVEALHRSCG